MLQEQDIIPHARCRVGNGLVTGNRMIPAGTVFTIFCIERHGVVIQGDFPRGAKQLSVKKDLMMLTCDRVYP